MSESNPMNLSQNSSVSAEAMTARLRRPLERAKLSDDRREMVRNNVGLVYLHMRHSVSRMESKWTQHEWEDLVQEGCLGLIRAARDFNPQGSIHFAAFALPRIHTAIRRAMLRHHDTHERCVAPASLGAVAGRGSISRRARRPPPDDPLESLDSWHGTGKDTIGLRLREKFDRAVRRAVEELATRDPEEVTRRTLQALADDRHLVPDAHGRKPYRQLAGELKVAYARVTHFDRMLRTTIARILSADPEFMELQRISRTAAEGVETRTSCELENRLAKLSAAELLQRILQSPADRRSRVITRLFDLAQPSLFEALERELALLPMQDREDLLGCTSPVAKCISSVSPPP